MKGLQITDREISWLSFDQRVLELAEDPNLPLLERVRFLAIFSSNLDEFYMVRVASLLSKIENNISLVNAAGYTPRELLKVVFDETERLVERQSDVFQNDILPGLNRVGITFVGWDELDKSERQFTSKLFEERIFPVLTPLAVDPTHPFPYISGLSLNLAVIVRNPINNDEFFARVKVPSNLPRLIATSKVGATRFLLLEDLIAIHLQELFPGMVIEDHYTFRVTRNQDIDLDDEETEDLLFSLEQELLRRKFGPPVRLEIEEGVDEKLIEVHPECKYVDDVGLGKQYEPMMYSIFDCKIDERGHYLSEDWLFCRRWAAVGGEIWAHSKVLLNHVGHYEYAGDLDKIAISERGSIGIIEDTLKAQGAKLDGPLKADPQPAPAQ